MAFLAFAALLIAAGCSSEKKQEAAQQTSADSSYFCPMHPEVVSNEPGVCPKCNMFLVHKDSLSTGEMEHMSDSAKIEHIENGSESSVQQYTCGMHPQIVTDEPGLCPICNMKLVPKSDVMQQGRIMVDAETQKKMGIALSPVEYRKLAKSIRAFGNVTYSEPKLYTVNIKFNGWVEKLYVNETGVDVKKGEPLMEIYSPELVAAQQEYLIAWQTSKSMGKNDSLPSKLIDASYQRLKNWDISEEQIQKLARTKEVKRTLTINAPFDGTVTMKGVKKGDNVMSGQELFKVADLSTVWVTAFVYEQDFPFIKKGQNASVTTASRPGEKFNSNLFYVSSFLDDNRQAEIRLSVNNTNETLKPNMYAEVYIKSSLPDENLSVPRSAVIKTGTREIVFVASEDGSYQARQVTTGVVAQNDLIEIKEGLHEGEFVVTSGQFMLDSESRLHEAIAGVGDAKNAPPAGHVH